MDNRKLALLFIVPAVALLASSHRRARFDCPDETFAGPAGGHHPHGPRRWGRWAGEERVPPMLAAMLDRWHRAAHAETSAGAPGAV